MYLAKEESQLNNRSMIKSMQADKSEIIKLIETKYALQTDRLAESVFPVILT